MYNITIDQLNRLATLLDKQGFHREGDEAEVRLLVSEIMGQKQVSPCGRLPDESASEFIERITEEGQSPPELTDRWAWHDNSGSVRIGCNNVDATIANIPCYPGQPRSVAQVIATAIVKDHNARIDRGVAPSAVPLTYGQHPEAK